MHSAIDKPRLFNRALIAGYSIAFFFNLAFSILGVAVFGTAVQQIIVNSLTASTAAKSIQILLSLDIFFTFLVVVVPSSSSVRKLLARISPRFAFNPDEVRKESVCVVFKSLSSRSVPFLLFLSWHLLRFWC